jgi:transcriptional regulator with XRE-family HTH domain
MSQLKDVRLQRGLTQAQLGALAGIAPQDISSIENGWRTPFPAWRQRISRALNMKEEQLFPEVAGNGRKSNAHG